MEGRQLIERYATSFQTSSKSLSSSLTAPADIEIQHDRERRTQRGLDAEGYLPQTAIPHLWGLEDKRLIISPPKNKVSPRRASRWPVVGGSRMASIDPRPLHQKQRVQSPSIRDTDTLTVRVKLFQFGPLVA